MKNLVLATNNAGKIKELQQLLHPIQCNSQSELSIESIDETGLSFVENAILKARHVSQRSNTPALADDSGLVVPALNGRPGIYSARFARIGATDNENIDRLLHDLIQIKQREAYFYCAIAVVMHQDDPTPLIAVGQLNGRISEKRMGHKGFGYDPIFYLDDYQCTLAELPLNIKNTISHRALAFHALRDKIFSTFHF